jgi:hypothetical protein
MPKPGPTDTVPALLTPGEHVMNKEAVALLGAENLAKANREGLKMRQQNTQGYRYGGEVKSSGIYRSGNSFSSQPSQFGTQLNLSSAPKISTPESTFETPNVNNTAKQLMGDNGSQAAIGAAVKPVYQDPSDLVPTGSTGFNAPIKNNLLQGFSCGTTDSAGVKKGIFAGQDRLLREKMVSNSQPSQVGNIGFLENTDLQGFANGGEVEGEGFTARPNYPGSIAPEKSLALTDQPVPEVPEPVAPKVRTLNLETMSPEAKAFQAGQNTTAGIRSANPGMLTRAAGLAGGLAKGALAGEALGAANNAIYNNSGKSPFSNVVTAAKTFALGDTENAKRQLFGLPAETAPALTRAAVEGVGKIGDAIGYQGSAAKQFFDGANTPEPSQEVPAAVPDTKSEPTSAPAVQAQEPPAQLTGQTLMPNDSNYANLGNGSYIKSGNTAGIRRVNSMVAAGGLSNPEKEARFARDAENTRKMAEKYGDGKPTQPSELDKLQDIALNGGATGDMTPTQFGSAKRRQNAAKELLGIRAHALQAKQNYDLQNKTLAQNAEIAKNSAVYDRQKDEADRELKKQELAGKTNNVTKILQVPIDPANPMLGTRSEAHTFNQATGEELNPVADKQAQQTRLQALTAALQDPDRPDEWKQTVIQAYNLKHPEAPYTPRAIQ